MLLHLSVSRKAPVQGGQRPAASVPRSGVSLSSALRASREKGKVPCHTSLWRSQGQPFVRIEVYLRQVVSVLGDANPCSSPKGSVDSTSMGMPMSRNSRLSRSNMRLKEFVSSCL